MVPVLRLGPGWSGASTRLGSGNPWLPAGLGTQDKELQHSSFAPGFLQH